MPGYVALHQLVTRLCQSFRLRTTQWRYKTTRQALSRSLIAQLDVPVSEIDEVFPEIVLRSGKRNLNKRPPLRPLRSADQTHVHFSRKSVALTRIAGDAGTNHVFPRRCSAPIARHNVVEVEFAPIKNLAAVLASVLVALKNIVASELYVLFRKPIEKQQHDHTRDTDLERNRRYHFMVGRVRGQIAPAFEIVRQEIVGVVRRDNLGMTGIYQRKGAARRADVHRLPEAVEHQNLTV